MGYLNYKGYRGSVEYNESDNCLFGSVLGIKKSRILYEGNTIDELKADFEAGINNYLDTCYANGIEPDKPFSGSLSIRISPEIHGKVAMLAERSGMSINAFIQKAIEHEIHAL
jgi:predicted HicB family RNase H-like nuclease